MRRFVWFVFSVYAAVSAEAATLYQDDFSDGNSSLWQTYASGWTEASGVFRSTNTAANTPVEAVYSLGYGWADYSVAVDVRAASFRDPSATGVLFRLTERSMLPTSSFAECSLFYSSAGTKLRMYTQVGAKFQQVSTPFAASANKWYRLRATAKGSTLGCEVEGYPATHIELTDSALQPKGTIGLRSTHIVSDFDNVLVEAESSATCSISCTATVPSSGFAGSPVNFSATSTRSNCTGTPNYSWNFGDGITGTGQNAQHTFAAGTYVWKLTLTQQGQTCTKSGTIKVATTPVNAPVLFVHGFCSSGSTWLPMIAKLQTIAPERYSVDPTTLAAADLYFDGLSVRRRIDNNSTNIPVSPVYMISFFADGAGGPTDGFDSMRLNDTPIAREAYQLSVVIAKILNVTGASSVDIVAHSMGGLVTRSYLEGVAYNNGSFVPYIAGPIRRVVTIDTPHNGSDFVKLTAQGICFAEDSAQREQMLSASDFFNDSNDGVNRRDLPGSVSLLAMITGDTNQADAPDNNDGIVTVTSQDLTTQPRYRCKPNIYTFRQDLSQWDYTIDDGLILHSIVLTLSSTAAVVNSWLGNGALPPANCQTIGITPSVLTLPAASVGADTRLTITTFPPSGKTQTAGCSLVIVTKGLSGATVAQISDPISEAAVTKTYNLGSLGQEAR